MDKKYSIHFKINTLVILFFASLAYGQTGREIAIMVDNETQTRVKTLTSTLEPIITVIMGAMILVLALSIFLPIWDMYESLANN